MKKKSLFVAGLALAVLFSLPLVSASNLYAGNDIVIFEKDESSDKAGITLTTGVIESAEYTGLVYKTGKGRSGKSTRYSPWKINWIKFADIDDKKASETYNEGVSSLQNGGWEKAARIFSKMLRKVGKQRRSWGDIWQIRKEGRRSVILYTTYYYHGYALLQSALEKQKIANQAYQSLLKIFPIGLSISANRKRKEDFGKHPDKIKKVKKAIEDSMDLVKRTIKGSSNIDAKIQKYLEEVEAADDAKKLEVVIGKFMNVCLGFYEAKFRAAIDAFNEPFKSASDDKDLDVKKYKPL